MPIVELRFTRARPRRGPAKAFAAQAWVRRLRRAVQLLQLWRERARQRRQLQCLNDRMLRDIGLTRADVFAEASKPFWQS